MTQGRVSFVGAGPGAADLITLRAARRIAEADIVIWAASLVHEDVLQHVRADALVVNSVEHSMEGITHHYERAAREGLLVARIHSGDPALWAARRSSGSCAPASDSPPRSSPESAASPRSRRSCSAS